MQIIVESIFLYWIILYYISVSIFRHLLSRNYFNTTTLGLLIYLVGYLEESCYGLSGKKYRPGCSSSKIIRIKPIPKMISSLSIGLIILVHSFRMDENGGSIAVKGYVQEPFVLRKSDGGRRANGPCKGEGDLLPFLWQSAGRTVICHENVRLSIFELVSSILEEFGAGHCTIDVQLRGRALQQAKLTR